MLDYLEVNKKMTLSFSLDGNKWANQLRIMRKNNNNSYDTVIANIKKAQERGIRNQIHMVTHPFNVAFIDESVIDLYQKGIYSIGVGTVESTMAIDEDYCETFLNQLDKVSKRMVRGELEGLSISLFNSIKPKEDVRNYIKDESGKVLGESYGRSGDDVTSHSEFYDVKKCDTENKIGEMIYDIRRKAYLNHQKNKITALALGE